MRHSHFLLSQQLWSSGQTFQPLVYSPGDSWPSVTSRQLLWCWPSDPFENFVFLRKSAAPGQLPWPVCSYNRDLLLIFQCLPGWALPISQGPAQITISLSRRRASQVVQWLKKKKSTCQCRRRKRCRFIPGLGRSLEKEMATHSSILVWEVPCTEEPGGLQPIRLQRIGYNLATKQPEQTALKKADRMSWQNYSSFPLSTVETVFVPLIRYFLVYLAL